MGMNVRNPTPLEFQRYIRGVNFGYISASQVASAGRVYVQMIEVMQPTIVKGITIPNAGTVAGNVTVGIYTEGGTNTPANGQLVVQSASTAQAGISTAQYIAFPSNTSLAQGAYYVAIEYSDPTATFHRLSSVSVVSPVTQYYFDQAYGTLPTTCPAVTADANVQPQFVVVTTN